MADFSALNYRGTLLRLEPPQPDHWAARIWWAVHNRVKAEPDRPLIGSTVSYHTPDELDHEVLLCAPTDDTKAEYNRQGGGR